MTGRRVAVFGPAYLDRVLRVDRRLVADGQGPPLDQSIEGEWKFGEGVTIEVEGPDGYVLAIEVPARLAGAAR